MVAIFQSFLILLVSFAHKSFSSPQTNLQDVWIPNLRGLPIGRNGEIVAEFEVSGLKISDERIKARIAKNRSAPPWSAPFICGLMEIGKNNGVEICSRRKPNGTGILYTCA